VPSSGEKGILSRLEANARWSRETAEQDVMLVAEELTEMPSIEEFRMIDRIAALD
jgi:hypothetical protein